MKNDILFCIEKDAMGTFVRYAGLIALRKASLSKNSRKITVQTVEPSLMMLFFFQET